MTVTFCGHSDFHGTDRMEKKILDYLEEKVGNERAYMYLGGYGGFDSFAYNCCKKYKMTHTNVSLVFVSPYLIIDCGKNNLRLKEEYDLIIYPEIEEKPRKYAITYRNKYMIEKSDCVVAYVERSFGGAYSTYKHAKRMGKEIFNLAQLEE